MKEDFQLKASEKGSVQGLGDREHYEPSQWAYYTFCFLCRMSCYNTSYPCNGRGVHRPVAASLSEVPVTQKNPEQNETYKETNP